MLSCTKLSEIQSAPCAHVGSNISERQADNEVLAMLLRDIPLTSDEFDKMRGNRQWVSMPIMIIAVGEAGFSSVPYVANSKVKQNIPTKRLYENKSEGIVTCYPFAKGKTNKDKGNRVETYEDLTTNEQVQAATNLHPGLCVSSFLREESFSGDKFFINTNDQSMLKAGDSVYIQIASANVEQAQKGQLLKFKKVMPANYVDTIIHNQALTHLPRSLQQYDDVIENSKTANAINKQVYASSAKIFSCVASSFAYAVWEPEKQRFVIVQASQEIPELECPLHLVQKACACVHPEKCLRLLNIALAMSSVHIILSHNIAGKLVLSGDCTAKAFWLYIDFRNLIQLQDLCDSGLTQGCKAYNNIVVNCNENSIVWTNPSYSFEKSAGFECNVWFRLDRQDTDEIPDEDEGTDPSTNNSFTESLITMDVPGPCHRLQVFLLPLGNNLQNATEDLLCDDLSMDRQLGRCFLDMQFNIKNLKETDTSSVTVPGQKRKRPAFE